MQTAIPCDAIDYLHGNFTYYVNKKATFISHPVFPYLSGRETIEERKNLHIWMLLDVVLKSTHSL